MFLNRRFKNFLNRGLRTANFKLAFCGLALLFLEGCATYSQNMAPVRAALSAGDVPAAVESFKKIKPSKDDLSYLLPKASLASLTGDWRESNNAFDDAERVYEELYTVSLTNEAFSLLTSDTVRPYRSNPQEMALVPYYRIFNYIQMGKTDDAMVEARKANNLYPVDTTQIGKMTERDIRFKAFLNYYTGLLYASQGESNDAIIALRNAYKLYRQGNSQFGLPVPRWLPADYYDAAIQIGLKDEVKPLAEPYPNVVSQAERNRGNNVVLFLESGFVPYREAVDIFLPLYKADEKADKKVTAQYYVTNYGSNVYAYQTKPVKLDQFLRLSYPKLVALPSAVASAEVLLSDNTSLRADRGLNLASVSALQFKQDSGDILLRTLLRALAKQGTLKAAQGESSGLGWLMNAINVVTEQADTRSWLLLPERIDVVKARVPDGTTSLTVRFLGAEGNIVEEKMVPVNPQSGKLQWISVRCFK